MIWYLLYPLRRTTEPPALSRTHPVYQWAARYGRYAARHVVTTLLISVAVATVLIYPIPFLFTNDFTNGASNLPHHVWTVAEPLGYDTAVEPDVVMRSIWVHANYMQALNTELLTSALDLQDDLLGITKNFSPQRPTSHVSIQQEEDYGNQSLLSPRQRDMYHVSNGLTNQSWFFHSPLLYWGCSRERILADPDIIATVNDKKNQSTSVNVTLRHSIVFSGKRFEDRRLLAADALVITLLHLRDSPVGRQWEAIARRLPKRVGAKWDIYPASGSPLASRLYEFQFRPLSVQDIILLVLGYGTALLYFSLSMSRNRAISSKSGLITAILTQIAFSVMSSFTVCAILNIDLSRVPRSWYPLVIFAMSQENIFRLLNAIICTRSEELTSSRIGIAFGETAHIAAVGALQNVLIMLGMSYLVSSAVSSFCLWVAVAVVFDFFYLSTFFLSVLSVDTRRTELSDALMKASNRHKGPDSALRGRATWLDQVWQGKVAFSTRVAGTVIMIGSVLIAQWHFFDEGILVGVTRLACSFLTSPQDEPSKVSLLENIHQARSPTSWLRLQDHETAREVINIIKPSAYSYVAQVFEPLVFVLKGSDRMPTVKERAFLPAAYDFVHNELARFLVIILLVVAVLRVLTSYLLWQEETSLAEEGEHGDEPLISVASFSGGHALDIAMLTASDHGLAVTVGLDRLIRIWDVRAGGFNYTIPEELSSSLDLFPVLAVAIDDESKRLAIMSKSRVHFWNLASRSWDHIIPMELDNQRIDSVFFMSGSAEKSDPSLIIVLRDGRLARIENSQSYGSVVFLPTLPGPLACAQTTLSQDSRRSSAQHVILLASRRASLVLLEHRPRSELIAHHVKGLCVSDIHQVLTLWQSSYFILGSSDRLYLFDVDEQEVFHTIPAPNMRPRSLRCSHFIHGASSGTKVGLTSFTLAYEETTTGDCMVMSFKPRHQFEAISLKRVVKVGTKWCNWEGAKLLEKRIGNPGSWELLSDGRLIGIRSHSVTGRDSGFATSKDWDGLKSRSSAPARQQERGLLQSWEVWTSSLLSGFDSDEVRPLLQEGELGKHLVISHLGPRVLIGQRSVALAFGNIMKVITVGGHERYDGRLEGSGLDSFHHNHWTRRRWPGSAMRQRAWSGDVVK